MFSKIDYAMVVISDMNRSVHFYQDILGLKLRRTGSRSVFLSWRH